MKLIAGSLCGWVLIFCIKVHCSEETSKVVPSQRQLSLRDTSKIRIPQSLPLSGSFQFEVSFGDQVTRFFVWGVPEEKYFYAESNAGRRNQGFLSQKNYDFLMRKAAEIKIQPGRSSPLCLRSNMRLAFGGEKKGKTACLLSKNETTKKMIDLSKVLSLLL